MLSIVSKQRDIQLTLWLIAELNSQKVAHSGHCYLGGGNGVCYIVLSSV